MRYYRFASMNLIECGIFQLLSDFDYRLHSTSSVECGPPVVTRIRLIAVLLQLTRSARWSEVTHHRIRHRSFSMY